MECSELGQGTGILSRVGPLVDQSVEQALSQVHLEAMQLQAKQEACPCREETRMGVPCTGKARPSRLRTLCKRFKISWAAGLEKLNAGISNCQIHHQTQ